MLLEPELDDDEELLDEDDESLDVDEPVEPELPDPLLPDPELLLLDRLSVR
ncbi:hypothetical protein SACE_0772 [Saccharopolyspora erythraea NRRL 2338]|uniref:Uncharacterized protein n=1 Tax=Saccharopolyspora erythraea (strain ATCC 11635 / DSM 40517 / JCM 4748 / NBRC 13426 / NCIMB 8594 / NRRL 2338) TaxID=405948 RepID=A4F7T9_SACEN|nr:hypothetical protein [Saccharopolyspora erythraea]EQD83835.1 hypothetical protein N599_23195 [Saccharopolyspora erythraea D]CAM00113.1 hypothetical protein SACE_0772 [Saccharopolyspora erythraea NRRL 2338]